MRAVVLGLLLVTTASVAGAAEPYHLIPGAVPLDSGPDGNTIVLDAPKGLIVFDTGRHPEHAQAIIDYAKGPAPADRGNRQQPLASRPHDRKLGYSPGLSTRPSLRERRSSRRAREPSSRIAAPRPRRCLPTPKRRRQPATRLLRGRAVIDHPERIAPNRVITRSGRDRRSPAGRLTCISPGSPRPRATSGCMSSKSRTVIAGDLVVGLVPFMDTACPEGWGHALDDIAKLPFATLIPGHGDPMTRADFLHWRTAYDNFVDCGHSTRPGRSASRAGAGMRRNSSTLRMLPMPKAPLVIISRPACGLRRKNSSAIVGR